MRHAYFTSLAILCLALCGTAHAEATLAGMKMGSHVSGPAVDASEFPGRVVLFEYWGVHCPPCLASIPHISELQEKYGRDRLIIIANHCQGDDDAKARATFAGRGGSDEISVINHGELKGAKVGGIPRCFLFDHEGKMIYDGSPFDIDEPIAKAIKASPGFLIAGRDFEKTKKEAASIGALESNLSSTLKSLRSIANGDDAAAKEEAEYLLGKVSDYCAKAMSRIEKARADDPAAVNEKITRMTKLFKGDELGEPFETLAKELKKDKAFQTELKAANMLKAVREHAKKNEFGPGSAKMNEKAARQLAVALQAIVKKYPDTKAAKDAEALAKDWQLL